MTMPNGQNPLAYEGVRAQNPISWVKASRAPGNNDAYVIPTGWVDTTTDSAYLLTSYSSGIPNWEVLGSPTSAVSQLDGDSGSATPSGGAITIAGGANITTSAASSTVTVALDSAVTTTSYATADAADGLTISSNDIVADGTNADIAINLNPKGTGSVLISNVGGTAATLAVSASDASGEVTSQVTNSDNTAADSDAFFEAAVGGTSGGNPGIRFQISGGQAFAMGIDNAATNDDLLICADNDIGTDILATFSETTKDVQINQGNLSVETAGKGIDIKEGANARMGTVTLSSGTNTVATTAVTSSSRIFLTRQDTNSSTGIGSLTVATVVNGTSFDVTALAAGATTETNDNSIVAWLIVEPA